MLRADYYTIFRDSKFQLSSLANQRMRYTGHYKQNFQKAFTITVAKR